MRIRRLAAGALAAGLMLSLSACGSDTSGNATAAGGMKPVAALTQTNFSQKVIAAQQGANSAHIDATIKAAGQSVSMSGDFSGFTDLSTVSMDMKLAMAGRHFEMRVVNSVLYVHGAGISSTQGKPWVKVDLNDPSNPLSKIMDTASPRTFMAYLQAVKNLKDEGSATVDGVDTHHYTVTIDTTEAMAAIPGTTGQDLSKLGLPSQLTTDVWLDGGNLPIKMTVKFGKIAAFEAHFSKYGEPVSVTAPPAKQVGSFSFGH